MSYLVPYDGSALADAALKRAVTFGEYADEEVVVLGVVPEDADYARERGWLEPHETFDVDLCVRTLRARSRKHASEARFRSEVVEDFTGAIDVVRVIREVASDVGASIVFVGSENAGRVVRPISSVGGPVAESGQYDVHIVRHADET